MAFGSTFNTKDPRFQQQLLRAGASPRGQRGLVRKITGDFAGEQLQKDLQFAETFSRHKYHQGMMGLKRKDLRFNKRMHRKNLRSEERGIQITTAAGLGTGVLSHLMGKRRAAMQQKARHNTLTHMGRAEEILRPSDVLLAGAEHGV